MENYGIKINVVTFIFMLLFLPMNYKILKKHKEITPISCYKFLLKEMMYSKNT